MTTGLPHSFRENIDWRRLSVAEGNGKYRFTTLKPIVYPLVNSGIPHPISFRDGGNHEWFRICPHRMVIPAGYSWNGSSPKCGKTIFGVDYWFGTPDFLPTIPASLIHDALFQFACTEHFPFSLEQSNQVYYDICAAQKFRLSNLYLGALTDFSKKFFGAPPKNGEHSVLL